MNEAYFDSVDELAGLVVSDPRESPFDIAAANIAALLATCQLTEIVLVLSVRLIECTQNYYCFCSERADVSVAC